MVEFSRWVAGDDVAGIQPHTVAGKEAGGGELAAVGIRSISVLGAATASTMDSHSTQRIE